MCNLFARVLFSVVWGYYPLGFHVVFATYYSNNITVYFLPYICRNVPIQNVSVLFFAVTADYILYVAVIKFVLNVWVLWVNATLRAVDCNGYNAVD